MVLGGRRTLGEPILDTVTPFSQALAPREPPIMVGMAPMGASAPLGRVFWGGQTLKVTIRSQQLAGAMAGLCLGYPALALAHGLVCALPSPGFSSR